jgi:ADP-ribose pyrophosphatase
MSNIPKHAKKVFSGIIFDVYHWEQELYDGTSTTFEALKRRGTAIVLPILYNGNILLCIQEQPGYSKRLDTL